MQLAHTEPSLLDDPAFYAGLERMESRSSAHSSERDLDLLQSIEATEHALAQCGLPGRRDRMPRATVARFSPDADALDPPANESAPIRRVVVHVAAFVLLMTLGAAASALVFHERVGRIITQRSMNQSRP